MRMHRPYWAYFSRVVALVLLFFSPALLSGAIWLAAVSGSCLDENSKPLAGAVFRFTNPANGKSFEVTSNAEGRFTYIAVEPAHYRLEVIRPKHQTLTFLDVYLDWSAQPLLLEINLQNPSVKVTRQIMLAETFGTEPPAPALSTTEHEDAAIARSINEKIAAAAKFMAAGDWDNARSAAKAATEIDPNRDLSWAWLANVYCGEAQHSTPPSANALDNCIQNYKRAIAISPNPTYFNNLGVACATRGRWEDAAENFRAAMLANPGHASLYHLNLGAALLKQSENSSEKSAALLESAAREFSAAASDTFAVNEAYYWKGLCELRLAAAGGTNATYAMARDSFSRYLQLAANGRHVSEARLMVESLDASHLESVGPHSHP
jgi:Tfp pilus assembly protein PilF